MPNPTSFERVIPSDLPTCTQFIYNINITQPTNRFLFRNWPDETFQLSYYHDGMVHDFGDPETEMWKLVESDALGISPEIVGLVILNRKKAKPRLPDDPLENERRLINETPKEINVDFRRAMRKALREVGREISHIDHYDLSAVYIKRSRQNYGYGKQLVQWALQKSREANIPLFVCSVPAAAGFYRKMGFIDTTVGEVDLEDWSAEGGGYGVYRLHGMMASTW